MELITELFDEDTTLPITNLNPKKKIPQIFSVHADDAVEQPGFRLCTYTSGGDTNRDLKPGDKMMHIVPFTLSAKGSIGRLKSVGSSPINYINAVFTTAFQTMKQYKIDACMLRILKSKTAGQARQLQVIAERLVRSRAGGRYVVLRELWDYDKKYAYILIHRKNIALEDIPGVPEISTELFTKVESKVGDVYVEIKTGTQVTKNTAIAASIAAENDKRSDQSVVAKIKISRRAVAQSQSVETERFENEKWEEYEASASRFSKPATAPLIPEASDLDTFISSKSSKISAANTVAKGLFNKMNSRGIASIKDEDVLVTKFTDELVKKIGDNKLTSVKSMQAYASILIENFYKYEAKFKAEKYAEINPGMDEELKQELVNNQWQKARADFVKTSLKSYAGVTSANIWTMVQGRSPKNYSAAEKRGIKEYVGSAYVDINNMLLGRYDDSSYEILDRSEAETAIKNLDSAFETGDRLPEGVTLWRAQSIRAPIYEALVKNRVFYFRNYVSSSLYPIIFGGWKANVAVGLIDDEPRREINIDKSDEDVVIRPGEITGHGNPENVRVQVGWAIDGADKINVVFPGDLSPQSQEMEVILPRGTMLKVNKITDASHSDGMQRHNYKFIQSEVMTSDQLDESIVYDGDVLMETGELVALSGETESVDFASFVSSDVKNKAEFALGIIASCIDIKDIPYKFVQG